MTYPESVLTEDRHSSGDITGWQWQAMRITTSTRLLNEADVVATVLPSSMDVCTLVVHPASLQICTGRACFRSAPEAFFNAECGVCLCASFRRRGIHYQGPSNDCSAPTLTVH